MNLFGRKKRRIAGKVGGLLPESGSTKIASAKKKLELGARANAAAAFMKMKDQFKDSTKCYRELVQNAMDAGTDRMYFHFLLEHTLHGKEQIQEYVALFADEFPQVASPDLEELVLDRAGETPLLQQQLGEGYTRSVRQPMLVLSDECKQAYLDCITEEGIQLTDSEPVDVDDFGFSQKYLQRCATVDDQLRYLDMTVELFLHNSSMSKPTPLNQDLELLLEKRKGILHALFTNTASRAEKQKIGEALRGYIPRKIGERKYKHLLDTMRRATKCPSPLDQFLDKVDYTLTIRAEDFGRGMTRDDRDSFLRKIFASSKGGDLEQTGRFGVGFCSVFALDPAKVVVESTRQGESWTYEFIKESNDSVRGRRIDNPLNPRQKGTQVSAVITDIPPSKARTMIEEAKVAIKRDCRHIDKPIYVDGETINRPFDIAAPVKVRFGRKGIEGYVGLVEEGTGSYILENNRIILEEQEKNLLEHKKLGDFEILVSAKYLNYDIARESVERDENLRYILDILDSQLDDLAAASLTYLSRELRGELQSKEEFDQAKLCWSFFKKYLERNTQNCYPWFIPRRVVKKFPKHVLDSPFINTIHDEELTFGEFAELLRNNKRTGIYISEERNGITDFLESKKKAVFHSPNRETIIKRADVYRVFRWQIVDVQKNYRRALITSDITDAEKKFLDLFRRRVRKSPMSQYIGKVYASRELNTEDAFTRVRVYDHFGGGSYCYNVAGKSDISLWDRVKQIPQAMIDGSLLRGGDIIVLNLANEYVSSLISDHALYEDRVAPNLLLQELSRKEGHLGRENLKTTISLFKEEAKRLGPAKYPLLTGERR